VFSWTRVIGDDVNRNAKMISENLQNQRDRPECDRCYYYFYHHHRLSTTVLRHWAASQTPVTAHTGVNDDEGINL